MDSLSAALTYADSRRGLGTVRRRIAELQRRIQERPLILIATLVAVWILWGFGYETVWARLTIEIDGTIAARHEVHASGRRGTAYVVRTSDGGEREYVAGATDASLSRDMPIGTAIVKRKWHLSYLRDGIPIDDFPIYAYSGTFGLALVCLLWAGLQLRQH
jgi:hypothetical protein